MIRTLFSCVHSFVVGFKDLLDDAESCKRRMTAASALIGGLAGEKVRWTEQSKQFKDQIDRYLFLYHLCSIADISESCCLSELSSPVSLSHFPFCSIIFEGMH